MQEVQITYLDVELTVLGHYNQGCSGDYYTPPEPRYFEIEEIHAGGVNIYELIVDEVEEIETIVLEKL